MDANLRKEVIELLKKEPTTCRFYDRCGELATTTIPHRRLGDLHVCAKCAATHAPKEN